MGKNNNTGLDEKTNTASAPESVNDLSLVDGMVGQESKLTKEDSFEPGDKKPGDTSVGKDSGATNVNKEASSAGVSKDSSATSVSKDSALAVDKVSVPVVTKEPSATSVSKDSIVVAAGVSKDPVAAGVSKDPVAAGVSKDPVAAGVSKDSVAAGVEKECPYGDDDQNATSILPRMEPVTASNLKSMNDPRLFVNRELSLLAFQWRVLEEAQDPRNPLLERFKFLSICGSNMDEFFMVRVAGLKRQLEAGSLTSGPDGMTALEQLDAIEGEVNRFSAEAQNILVTDLMPGLDEAGIIIVDYNELSPEQREDMRQYFLQKIFPILTPMAFDPGHPFPHISNLSLNFAVSVRKSSKDVRFARLKIPDSLPQLISIARPPSGTQTRPGKQYIWIDDVIQANLDALFPGMTIIEAHPFHITRDAEVEIQEWEASDLLETTEEGVRQRKFGDVVRLQVDRAMPAHVLEILMTNLQIEPCDVYLVEGHFPLSSLKYISSVDRPDLKYPQYVPHVAKMLNPDSRDEDEFTAIARRDILLNHPYDSFQPIVNLLNRAADDPSVLAIKMTLYRVGRNSPVVEALLRAMEKGKQVAVVVELKARFDEESNIEWARALEREGVHVVYGLIGLKIHAKVLLIVRRSGDSIKRYIHLSTGNYNPLTAHLYTDLGLLTSDESIGSDVSDLFNYLTGYSAKTDYRKLLVAPINLREKIESLIRREIEHHKNGKNGHVILKANALVDERFIQLLYEASQAGVKVDLIVRGICCLRPGIPGISENIRVTSIVGRFLEHSRIFYFRNCGNEEIYIGSADSMPRNLDRRVEVVFPIEDPGLNRYIKENLLDLYLKDTVRARIMQTDGTYVRLKTPPDTTPVDCQQVLLEKYRQQLDPTLIPHFLLTQP